MFGNEKSDGWTALHIYLQILVGKTPQINLSSHLKSDDCDKIARKEEVHQLVEKPS